MTKENVQAEAKENKSSGIWSYAPPLPSAQNIKDFWRVVSPYFSRENAGEIAFTVAANVVPSIISGLITSSYAHQKQEENPEEQAMLSTGAAIVALVPVVGIAIRLTTNSLFGTSLRTGIKKGLIEDLGEEGMMVLKDHTSKGVQGLPPVPEILTQHTATFANNAVPLTIGMAGCTMELFVMLVTGYKMVGPKAAMTSTAASMVLTLAMIKAGNMASDIWKKNQTSGEGMSERITHSNTNRSQIAALNAQWHEQKAIIDLIEQQEETKFKASYIQLLSSCINMSAFFAYPQILRSLGHGSFYPENITGTEIDAFSAQALHSMASMRDMSGPLTKGRTELGISMGKIIKKSILYRRKPLPHIKHPCLRS